MTRTIRALGVLLIAAMLAACGGHGSMLPSTPQSTKTGYIKATLAIPPAKQSASRAAYAHHQLALHANGRHPDDLSGNTTELDFVLQSNNGNAASAADQQAFDFSIYTSNSSECTGSPSTGWSCSVTAPAPVGTDTYKIISYQCSVSGSGPSTSCQSLGGTLNQLAQSYVTVNVAFNQTVVAAFTLSPVVASIDWATVSYAEENTSSNSLPNSLWLSRPNGSHIPKYNPSPSPGTYSCTYNAGTGTNNACYEPVAQGVKLAYGEVLEARDPSGALIVGASGGGAVYQTPVYEDSSGNAITISWSCKDFAAGGRSLTWETGGGPYGNSQTAPQANQNFNSPVANPQADPDGGNTTDGNGKPVTAVGNNGVEMNFDGLDQPLLDSPDYCTASTSNGLSTALNFYAGLGEGGVVFNPTPTPAPTFGPGVYALNQGDSNASYQGAGTIDYFGQVPDAVSNPSPAFTLSDVFTAPDVTTGSPYSGALAADSTGKYLWAATAATINGASSGVLTEYAAGQSQPLATITGSSTLLQTPSGIAVDTSGNVYVYDGTCSCVYVYASGANGNVAPVRTMTGLPSGGTYHKLFFDPSGNLWFSERGGTPSAAAYEYSASTNGAATAMRTLNNSTCYGSEPNGDLICKQKVLGVLTASSNYVTMTHNYSLAIAAPVDVDVDSAGFVYISNCGTCGVTSSGGIDVFDPPSVSSGQYLSTIPMKLGSSGQLYYPESVAVLRSPAATPSPAPTPTLNPNAHLLVSQATSATCNGVAAFDPAANGNVAPLYTIKDANVTQPSDAATDAQGNVYVANGFSLNSSCGGTSQVVVFAPGATSSDLGTILPAGPMTSVFEVAVDGLNDLYVAGSSGGVRPANMIEKFGQTNPPSPTARSLNAQIPSNATTQIVSISSIAAASDGTLYVANNTTNTSTMAIGNVLVFGNGQNGPGTAPMRVIGGATDGIGNPQSVALDGAGHLFVLTSDNGSNPRVLVFNQTDNGNVTPIATISGTNTQLDTGAAAYGMVVDPQGGVYVANAVNGGSVLFFAPGSNGNVAPTRIVNGSNTALSNGVNALGF